MAEKKEPTRNNDIWVRFSEDGSYEKKNTLPLKGEWARFSHIGEDGSATMVDVGDKQASRRVAIAASCVKMAPATLDLLARQALPKGDVLTTAKIAGIMAAKNTEKLIPLCHQVPLDYVDVKFRIDFESSCIHIEAEARTYSRTGVEMEALTAAQVAALTIYDMCKAVQKDLLITDCRLLYKAGGRSGDFNAV